jgi:hypothetical protein
MSHTKTLKITPTCFDHQMIIIRERFWSWLKSLVKIWVFKCGYAAAYVHSFCMLYCMERHVDWGSKKLPDDITWWSKHVGVILSILVCDIWINVLLQTSALVGPLYIENLINLKRYILHNRTLKWVFGTSTVITKAFYWGQLLNKRCTGTGTGTCAATTFCFRVRTKMFERSQCTKCIAKDDEAKFCEIMNTHISILWLLMNQILELTWQYGKDTACQQQSVRHTEQLQAHLWAPTAHGTVQNTR